MEFIEKELKYQLTMSDYHILGSFLDSHYRKLSCRTHVNYYLDTEKLTLKKNGISVRLRMKAEGSYKFTIKSRITSSSNNIHIKKESTIDITLLTFNEILKSGNLKEYKSLENSILLCLPSNKLEEGEYIKVLGSLTTERTAYIIDENIEELVIDKSQYCGKEDYEIEWETNELSIAKTKILNIFKELNIKPMDNFDSKTTRFLKVYLNYQK